MKIERVILEGLFVRLEPLGENHHAGLCEVGLDLELWKLIPIRVQTPEDMRLWIRKLLEAESKGTDLPFATGERSSGKVVGGTRFMNIDIVNRHVEIGGTWVAPQWQRTAINTEAKYLMLQHAFEVWKCFRVELKTDALNQKSRDAILRIGAKEEGTLRKHTITWDGRVRDTVYFSILDTEWPRVKLDLEQKIRMTKT
jgi:RimJ/RimL family protein N-acetyltransferase